MWSASIEPKYCICYEKEIHVMKPGEDAISFNQKNKKPNQSLMIATEWKKFVGYDGDLIEFDDNDVMNDCALSNIND